MIIAATPMHVKTGWRTKISRIIQFTTRSNHHVQRNRRHLFAGRLLAKVMIRSTKQGAYELRQKLHDTLRIFAVEGYWHIRWLTLHHNCSILPGNVDWFLNF